MRPKETDNSQQSIRLEPFTDKDSDRLISWVGDEEMLMQFGGPAFTFPLTQDQLEKNSAQQNRLSYKVVDVNTNAMIGYAEIYLSQPDIARLCRLIIGDKSQRGNGTGQKLVNQLLEIAFTKFSATKADLNVFDFNTAAIRCYEKCGFKINPDKSLTRHVKGETWNGLNMEIDKENWEKRNKQ